MNKVYICVIRILPLIFSPDCDSLNKYMYLHVNFDMYNTIFFVLLIVLVHTNIIITSHHPHKMSQYENRPTLLRCKS